MSDNNSADYSYDCAFCHAKVNGEGAFKSHIESEHLDEIFKFPCKICGFQAEGPRFLRDHVEKVHDREAKIDNAAPGSPISDVSVDDRNDQLIEVDSLEWVDEPQIKTETHPLAKMSLETRSTRARSRGDKSTDNKVAKVSECDENLSDNDEYDLPALNCVREIKVPSGCVPMKA